MRFRGLLVVLAVLALFVPAHAGVDNILKKAKQEGRIVMLELGSEGCIPCEKMKPVMERLRKDYKGKLDVVFVDVKKDKATGRQFGVYMIPVQVFLDKSGKEAYRHVGYFPYEEIVPVLKTLGL
ncbi:MAG: thioredoxin family protein [Nitrospirales bacterium]|nr:thioredoxin family protein [Nitrospirales bacterium]